MKKLLPLSSIILKSIVAVFLLTICNNFLFSQNLVNNWSFELYDTCPPGQGNLRYALGWNSYHETPDYFNLCDSSGQAGIPSNNLGYQYPKTGNAYAGFYAFALYGHNGREIIGSKLTQTLNIGQKYFVNFYINRAYKPNPGWHVNIAVNKIGARFSTIPYTYWNPVPIDNFSQVYTDSIITDTLNWVKISGSFISDSAYNYVSFGNFFTDSASTYILFDTLASLAYYFIDDIIVSTDSLFNGLNNFSNSLPIIKIFPNPARDWIMIEGSGIKSYSIIDIFGRKYIEDAFAPTPLKSIFIGNLSKGIYFIQIKNLTQSSIQKFIIQ